MNEITRVEKWRMVITACGFKYMSLDINECCMLALFGCIRIATLPFPVLWWKVFFVREIGLSPGGWMVTCTLSITDLQNSKLPFAFFYC